MPEKNMLNMKRYLIKKKEENKMLKSNIKDLIAPNFKINKKLEISLDNYKLKKIKKKLFQTQLKEKQERFNKLIEN